MKKQKGKFTLIELLVVIAIIGILATLLLPSLSRARLKALDVVCMSNQKQIGTSISIYTLEDHKYPSHRNSSATSSWIDLVNNGSTFEHFLCPRVNIWKFKDGSTLKPDVSTAAMRVHRAGYGYNGYWMGYYPYTGGVMSRNYTTTSDVLRADELIMISDSSPIINGGYKWASTIWYPYRKSVGDLNEGVKPFHGNKLERSNITFADGHVKSMNSDQINLNDDEFKKYWNPNPDLY